MIRLQSVNKNYGSGSGMTCALKDVTVDIDEGSFTVILGASGSGKSTLLNVVSGLERVDSGKILFGDVDIASMGDKELTLFRRRSVGLIFQQYYLIQSMNVEANVKMGADLVRNTQYKEIIDAVGLSDKLDKYPSELSGGEQQRVAIARALAKKPCVLFADEPTGALDYNTGKKILKLLYDVSKQRKRLVIVVTHNSALKDMADKVVYIKSGRIERIETNARPVPIEEIEW